MGRNIVLIVLDAVRKDYFDQYAPRLKELTDVSFEQCRAGSSCSVPSHGAILTGELPHENGVIYTDVRYDGIELANTFLGDLSGHRTFGVSANPWASTEFGFGDYFDDFVNISRHRRFQGGMDITHFVYDESDASGIRLYLEFLKAALSRENTIRSLSNGVFAQANRSLSKLPAPKPLDDGASVVCREINKRSVDDDQPFFCFTNFMDAHSPMQHIIGYDRSLHDVPLSWSSLSFDHKNEVTYNINDSTKEHDEFISNYRQLYGASIDYLDRKVSNLISEIQSNTKRETTFIITADHGENLGHKAEDYFFGHNGSLSEALLHVPLCLVNPPEGFYDKTEDGYFSHLDLGKLIVSLANEEYADVFRESVPAELIGGYPDKLVQLVSEETLEYHSRAQRCVLSGESKYLWDSLGGSEMYQLDGEKPNWQERESINVQVPQWATEHFSVGLREFCESIDKKSSYDDQEHIGDDTKKRLKELGYL